MMEEKDHQPVPTPTVSMIDDEPDLRKMTTNSFADLAGMAEIPGLHTNRC
jgi:hypothetical protein